MSGPKEHLPATARNRIDRNINRIKLASMFIETPEHVEDFVARLREAMIPPGWRLVDPETVAAIHVILDHPAATHEIDEQPRQQVRAWLAAGETA